MSAVCLTSVSPSVYAQTVPAPHAVFPETLHEFGVTPEGTEIKHDFIVKNTGTAPLNFKIKPG